MLPGKPGPAGRIFGRRPADLRYVAIGGALSAGMRSGGVYREAQLTSFAGLLAAQLGVTFRQPLFDQEWGNGSGYKLAFRTGDGRVRHRHVTNQLGIEKGGWHHLKPYSGEIDNFSFPYLSKNLGSLSHSHDETRRFVNRITGAQRYAGESSLFSWLKKQQQCDFFTFEIGMDDLVSSVMKGGKGGIFAIDPLRIDRSDEVRLIRNFAALKARGVLATVPDVINFPYFRQVTGEMIRDLDARLWVHRSTSREPVAFDPAIDILLPGFRVQQILDGTLKGDVVLKDEEVLSRDPYDDEWSYVSPALFNQWKIRRTAAELDYPVADLHRLYEEVLAGRLVTADGVKVDPRWPEGNFFSADGITPTAFGHAVIANEFIRVLNNHYKLSVPFLITRDFL